MKIAMLLPSLSQKGPIIVAKDIIEQLSHKFYFEVFYFDDIVELEFPCLTKKIDKSYEITGFDLIHSHMLRPDFYSSKLHKNIIRICTLHNYMYQDLSDSYGKIIGYIYEKIWCKKIQNFDRIVTLSDNMKTYYQSRIESNKIITIYNGRPSVVSNHEQLNIKNDILKFKGDSKLIGVFCSIIHRKGIDRILNMLTLTDKYKLLLVGEGKEKQRLEKMGKMLGVNEKILWVGFHKKPHLFYEIIDLNIMSSRSEGFPLALLEMGMHKIPVACVEHDIFKELYTGEEVSYFLPDNPESMLSACDKLILEHQKFSNLIYLKTMNKYNVENMGNSYYQLYKSL